MSEFTHSRPEQNESTFLNPEVAAELLQIGQTSGGQITYDQIVGYGHDQYWVPSQLDTSYMIRPRNEVKVEQPDRVAELKQAKDGLSVFLGVMVDAHAKGGDPNAAPLDLAWFKEPDEASVRKSRIVVYKLFGNRMERSWMNEDSETMPLVPYLGYQNGKPFSVGTDTLPGVHKQSDFLHFGTQSKEVNKDGFDGSVRVYLNPKIEQTGLAAGLLAADFEQRMGYIPRGKFVEDATAEKSEDRKDRLIFWTHSPEELTTLMSGIKSLAEERPDIFEGREGMALGTPAVINGVEVPTVRLAQDPSSTAGEVIETPSFNSSRLPLINKALSAVLGSGLSQVELESSFTAELQAVSKKAGVNVRDFNFNASQDLSVIDAAIAAAA